MAFFQGDITEAIAKAKSAGLLFVVAVHGDNADSQRLDNETWSQEHVINLLQNHSVALRLVWNSELGKQFIAFCTSFMALHSTIDRSHKFNIDPVFTLPTIYFINPTTGQPLHILMGFQSCEAFCAKFYELQQQMHSTTSSESAAAAPPASTLTTSSPTPTTPPSTPPQTLPPSSPPPSTAASSTELSTTQKVKLVKEKIAQKRKERAAEEEAREKEREIARRRNGQLLQATLQSLEERKRQKEIEERKREQDEERKAKERIKEQIRLDRLERTKQKQQSNNTTTTSPATTTTSTPATAATTAPSTPPQRQHNSAVLQFRLVDGSTVRNTFAATDTLQHCREWLEANTTQPQRGGGRYQLSTTVPRRIYTQADLHNTMAELGLVPNATLLVTPADPTAYSTPSNSPASTTAGSGAGGGGWLSSITNFIKTSLWIPTGNGSANSRDTQTTPTTANVPAGNSANASAGVREVRGRNIHRLSHSSENDSNRYWNGNSTQFDGA